jgi:hypothetical protein
MKQASGGAEAHETLPDASGSGHHVVGEKDHAVFIDETPVAFRALAGRSQGLAAELCGLKRVKHRGLRDKQSARAVSRRATRAAIPRWFSQPNHSG